MSFAVLRLRGKGDLRREGKDTRRGRPRLASGDPTAAPSEGLPRDQARIPRRRGPRVPGKSDQPAPRADGRGGDDGWSVGRASFEGAARTAAARSMAEARE